MIHYPDYEKSDNVSEEFLTNFDYQNQLYEVIIVDLGLARNEGKDAVEKTFWGSLLYMAPEMINGQEYDAKVDIWAFGTVVYQMLVGFSPFYGKNMVQLIENINKGIYGIPKHLNLSTEIIELLSMWLQADPDDRPDHSEVLEYCIQFNEESKREPETEVIWGFQYPKNAKFVNEDNSYILSIKDPKYYHKAMASLKYTKEDSLLMSLYLDEEELSKLKEASNRSSVPEEEDDSRKLPSVVKTALSNTEMSEFIEKSMSNLTIIDTKDWTNEDN